MTSNDDERRECTRTPFNTTVLLSTEIQDVEVEANLQNISISGMYVEVDQSLPVGTHCSIKILIKGQHSYLTLDDIQGDVVREDEGGVALCFTSNMEWFVLFKIYIQYAGNNS